MILIAHRGNIDKPESQLENSPEYITHALTKGYDVEIDVWYQNRRWLLGHDNPSYPIEISFLKQEKLWCHAKNIPALFEMLKNNIHCFYHQDDDVVLTSRGYMWTYPGHMLTSKSICVMPEWEQNKNIPLTNCAGICSDFVEKYNK